MSGIDLLILLVILISAIVGLARGFFKEFVSLATWVAAIVITLLLTSRFATLLPSETIESPVARAGISAIVLFLGSMLIGGLINWLFRKAVAGTSIGVFDRLLGVGFGLVRGVLIIALLVLAANLVPALKQESWWRESFLLPRFQLVAQLMHAQLPPEIAQHFDFTRA